MFHWVKGIPFEFNAGAYDNQNMWEQIDNGDQYTPAKKFLLTVPIVLCVSPLPPHHSHMLTPRHSFLMSTHYTHYDLMYFTINCLAVLSVVIPKLPWVRLPTSCPYSSSSSSSSFVTPPQWLFRALHMRVPRSSFVAANGGYCDCCRCCLQDQSADWGFAPCRHTACGSDCFQIPRSDYKARVWLCD